ncbi:hypothetical protein E4634_07880 [Mangrovimicrobium sediminis]|uniref:Tetratricopeptide repeat protein n=1 Tax=Mangrovimicrobium sediminis TaxID=2562682 RepID=A0A4Z0M3E4_9GAMM|nr:hypothetical protein [Haliea sp. SAOS-164]TGD74049.1 hypothetical protein E4634_07880 [Haliea sp. SAOS-164]
MSAWLPRVQALPVLLLLLLLGTAAWLYYPGVQGPVLLDDISSLGGLSDVAQAPEQALDYVLGDNSGPLGRGVSMATFVVERLLGGDFATSKLVNICLHLLIGVVVAWLLVLLLAPLECPGSATMAVLCAGLWLLAPLQVSTVLYVVQRMAQLAALFSLLSLVAYIYWRRSLGSGRSRYRYLLLSVAAFTCGVFSKENALVTLPIVLLLEACWLQFRDQGGRVIGWLRKVTYGGLGIGVAAVAVLLAIRWDSLTARYHFRDFTLLERILTEPRILWDYLAQFYWPDIARLGIFHDDFPVSTSLWQPATTLPAILAWVVLLLAVALSWRWSALRRLSFCALFFLAGHSLESTVWPLELYFEHRNYLPSVGLVLLPLTLYALLVKRWRELARPLQAWMAALLLLYAAATSSQVQIWSSAHLLALQQVNGHPDSARANKQLATQLAYAGARDAALKYSQAAYELSSRRAAAGEEHYGDYILRNLALACIARQPLAAEEYRELGRRDPRRPLGVVATMSVVIKLRENDVCADFDWEGFLDHLNALYLQRFDTRLASANMFTALAILANANYRWEDAFEYTARSLQLSPGRTRELLMQLHFATALRRDAEVKNLIAQLQAKRDAGKLSRGERDTLALYLEGED